LNSATRLIVPPLDPLPWPTLGGQVCDWIEAHLVHGPGDVLGEPATILDEIRLFLYRAYEVYPRGHELEGRRRFKRAALSRRKGFAKTEIAAWVAIAELDPTAPVRFDGWDAQGEPVGRPVRDPYIPMVAYTEEQTADLAYAAVYEILAHSPLADSYDIGLERITHATAPGKLVALASAPSARDGARTTFQHFDETHRFTSQRLKEAHATMLRNVPKRKAADPWTLETTTMYLPGENSVAEGTHRHALAIVAEDTADPRLLFDHRQASEGHDLSRPRSLRVAITEASGDAIDYTDVEAVAAQFHDPQADLADLCRYWLNQLVKGVRRWLAPDAWERLADPSRVVEADTEIVLGFDGSYARDSTALIGATVEERPHIFVIGLWEKPLRASDGWRVSALDVESAVAEAMETWKVVELAPDPPGWVHQLEEWEATYGDVVVRFETKQPSRMGPAVDAAEQAIRDGTLSHDGNPRLAVHVANCVPVQRAGYTVVTKAATDSPDKIDAAVGFIVAHHRASWWATHPRGGGVLYVF
jgi:phage terminase large subunit-like protein